MRDETDSSNQPIDNVVPGPKRSSGGMFRQLQLVLIVAVVIATLFTAWSEPGLLPGGLSERLSNALALQRVTPQPAWPTNTPRANPRIGIVAGHSGNDS